MAAWAVGGTILPSSWRTSCTAAQSPMAQMSLCPSTLSVRSTLIPVRSSKGSPKSCTVWFGRLPAVHEPDAVLRYLLGHGVYHHLDPLVGEPGAGGAPEGGIQLQQDVRQGFDEVDP